MQYELTDEQALLQTTVRRLAKEKVSPGAGDRDEAEEFDWDMVELLRENGLYGTDFPEIHGGSEAGILPLCLAIEELSKADASCGLLLADQELGSLPILLAANESQRQRYLPQLAWTSGLPFGGICAMLCTAQRQLQAGTPIPKRPTGISPKEPRLGEEALSGTQAQEQSSNPAAAPTRN
jgi:alkylation response protein AidB-like acyl-CoA dehydrogenase